MLEMTGKKNLGEKEGLAVHCVVIIVRNSERCKVSAPNVLTSYTFSLVFSLKKRLRDWVMHAVNQC